MKDAELAARIGELVGGPDNTTQVTHCATRLRFVIKDKNKVERDQLGTTKGVIQVVDSGGQIQVVIGPGVGDVYQALLKTTGWAAKATGGKDETLQKQGFIDWLFGLLAGTFQPLFLPLMGSSMLLMVYGLGLTFSWFDPSAPGVFWSVLYAACNAFFYFLPIFIAATASQRLGGTPFLAAAIAGALLHPSFTGLGEVGDVVNFLGAPLYVYSYTSSVFPAILIAIALSYLEPFLRRILPKNLHLVLVPTLCLAVLVPMAVLVIGPIGTLMGNGLTGLLNVVNDFSPILMGAVFAGVYILMVMFGLHWALVPIQLATLATGSGNPLAAMGGAYNFAVWGLAVAVFLRAPKGSDTKELAGAGALSGLIAGISEPMLYGVILRYKRVFPMIIGAAAIGGAIIGGFQVRAQVWALNSLLTIPVMVPTIGYLLGIGVSFGLMFAGIMIFGYESNKVAEVAAASGALTAAGSDSTGVVAAAPSSSAALSAPLSLTSPLAGKVIPLSEVPDPVFAGGAVGAGVGILPSDGRVVAPCDGTVIVAPASGHAVGLRTTDGVELLIHVGIDTVNLAGRGFTTHVEVKQEVKAGDALIDVDLKTIEEAGYSLATPVLITNARKIGEVSAATDGSVAVGDPLLVIAPARQDTSAS